MVREPRQTLMVWVVDPDTLQYGAGYFRRVYGYAPEPDWRAGSCEECGRVMPRPAEISYCPWCGARIPRRRGAES